MSHPDPLDKRSVERLVVAEAGFARAAVGGYPTPMFPMFATLLLLGSRPIYADGNWAGLDQGDSCAAVSRSARIVTDRSQQAHAGFLFDKPGHGRRRGQFAARLGQTLRPGSTVLLTIGTQPFLLAANDSFAWSRGPAQEAAIVAAARVTPAMRIEARGPQGGRFVDLYALDGAPGAIDAAAACASHR